MTQWVNKRSIKDSVVDMIDGITYGERYTLSKAEKAYVIELFEWRRRSEPRAKLWHEYEQRLTKSIKPASRHSRLRRSYADLASYQYSVLMNGLNSFSEKAINIALRVAKYNIYDFKAKPCCHRLGQDNPGFRRLSGKLLNHRLCLRSKLYTAHAYT